MFVVGNHCLPLCQLNAFKEHLVDWGLISILSFLIAKFHHNFWLPNLQVSFQTFIGFIYTQKTKTGRDQCHSSTDLIHEFLSAHDRNFRESSSTGVSASLSWAVCPEESRRCQGRSSPNVGAQAHLSLQVRPQLVSRSWSPKAFLQLTTRAAPYRGCSPWAALFVALRNCISNPWHSRHAAVAPYYHLWKREDRRLVARSDRIWPKILCQCAMLPICAIPHWGSMSNHLAGVPWQILFARQPQRARSAPPPSSDPADPVLSLVLASPMPGPEFVWWLSSYLGTICSCYRCVEAAQLRNTLEFGLPWAHDIRHPANHTCPIAAWFQPETYNNYNTWNHIKPNRVQ